LLVVSLEMEERYHGGLKPRRLGGHGEGVASSWKHLL